MNPSPSTPEADVTPTVLTGRDRPFEWWWALRRNGRVLDIGFTRTRWGALRAGRREARRRGVLDAHQSEPVAP